MVTQGMSDSGQIATGGKRKRAAEPKFYAVRVGATPGIYPTWAETLEQVRGVKGASFKSFSTQAEAQDFIEHGLRTSQSQKFYAVRNGRVPGIYTDWPSAEGQIKGFTKPKYKSFASRTQAEAFMNGVDDVGEGDGGAKSKKQKKPDAVLSGSGIDQRWQPGAGPLPEGATDGFDPRIVMNPQTGKVQYKSTTQRSASKMMPIEVAPGQPLRVYTDGSALKNGTIGARAGVGVYFGPQDSRNVSEGLAGSRQTNQRAELTAVMRAIELAPRDRSIVIITDSKYSISCCTEWFQSWRRNGWQTADKKPVENRDLIEPIIAAIDERYRLRSHTTFEWIKGHAEDQGNNAADRLAVDGARRAMGSDFV